MVATRRGVRVNSPAKNATEQRSDVQATPSTGPRTRNAAKQVETTSQHSAVETCGQLDSREGRSLVCAPGSSIKRCTRAFRLHSPEQPSTPVSSTHDVDTSDMESCCSVVSDIELPVTRSRGRRRQPRAGTGEDEEVSEVESCSSAVSAPKLVHSSRRSTRKKTVPESCGTAHTEAGSADPTQKTESCSSVASKSQRVTRSQRKTRSAVKQQTEDSELSDVDSCTSGVSGRASRRKICPIPMHLDELSEGSQSPARTTRRTRATRGPAARLDVSEPPSCDSEGFESGPTYSLSTRTRSRTRSTGPKATDSESEVTDVHSPVGNMCPTRSRGTPCSSRAGSRTSSRIALATGLSEKDSTVMESAEEGSLNDSRLETTVIESDADCTLLEDDEMQTSVDQEEVTTHTKNVDEITDMSDCKSHVAPTVSVCAKVLSEHAVIVSDQQEEPSAENNERDTSENEIMQETILSSLDPCQSVKVTICERASEGTEGADEGQEAVDTQLSLVDKSVDEDVETQPSVEDKMEVITLKTDAQQVVDTSEAHAEPIQVTLSQKHKVTVDFPSEEQTKDVLVQNTKVISLLDSSNDDDEFNDEVEQEVSEEEDLGHGEEERGETSKRSEAAASSVDGLFMIDTRPGQEADILYYREAQEEEKEVPDKGAEQEEEDEEFVDEEEEGDDDDEDAKVLFSSRSDQLKELSSRIDPGIRVKELGGLYISFDGSKSKPVSGSLQKLKEKKIQDEVMKKSVIGPDFEKKDAVPPYSESKQALKLKRRAEREKSTGDAWFNMKAPEMTQELKGDLQVLKMRGSLDPKRFYKKNDRDGFPKYFQVGTVVDSPVDFYHSRIPKKERKRTMVEELLADADFRQQNKKRFQQIMTEKAAQRAGMKNKKKKKQFHKKSN